KRDSANGKPSLETELRLYKDGRQIFDVPPAPVQNLSTTDGKRVQIGGRLRLARSQEPGQYVLQIVVTDKLAKRKYSTTSQWSDFEVVEDNPANAGQAEQ
ncbi:MAG TPA: hypothetical protein VJX67_23085, partial [Blastocatellia bacterium]|nr:hypothetical protein [Blastocatellia bacterium]